MILALVAIVLLSHYDRLPNAIQSTISRWFDWRGSMTMLGFGFGGGGDGDGNSVNFIPLGSSVINKNWAQKCDHVTSDVVWRERFPMLTIESALRVYGDANRDTIEDVIVPFGTGVDAAYYDSTLCQIYFNQTEAESSAIGCGGGVMSIDGRSGKPLWIRYTPHELFAANCAVDINQDGVNDCIIGGRMASLYAFDGKQGTILWSIDAANANIGSSESSPIAETSNFYTPLLIPRDVDGDGVSDIVVMHGGDPLRKSNERVRNIARLMIISTATGRILSWRFVPDRAESYYSPQLLTQPDGVALILFGTGGETHPGALYIVPLDELYRSSGRSLTPVSRPIYRDCCKGVITPPVLIDITGDGVADIVMANFNSTIIAFDGLSFEQIWSRRFADAETYSSPSVGFFNRDNVPDFGVTYQIGAGFPIYYYAEFSVIDGRNGELLAGPIRMPIGTQSSPLTVSTFAQNDFFLFWWSSCYNESSSSNSFSTSNTSKAQSPPEKNQTDPQVLSSEDYLGSFQISPDVTVHDASRADFCRLRFGASAKQYTQYRAITADSSTPISIYDSRHDEPTPSEKINYTKIAYDWYAKLAAQLSSSSTSQTNPFSFHLPQSSLNNIIEQQQSYISPQDENRNNLPQIIEEAISGGVGDGIDTRIGAGENEDQKVGGFWSGQSNGFQQMDRTNFDNSPPPMSQTIYRPDDTFAATTFRKYKKSNNQYGGGGGDDDDFDWKNEPKVLKFRKKKSIEVNRKLSKDGARQRSRLMFDDHKYRVKRHVGLHNGDAIQRVISTGTLAPSLPKTINGYNSNNNNNNNRLSVDGSIDVIFATYSFPASTNVRLMSAAMRRCIAEYMAPEREIELRLRNEDSIFKRQGYDHDAYEAAIREYCAKQQQQIGEMDENDDRTSSSQPQQKQQQGGEPDLLRDNDLLREFGSMTLHRVSLRCFERSSGKQIPIKEYRYQWWPAYLGIAADAVANLIDE